MTTVEELQKALDEKAKTLASWAWGSMDSEGTNEERFKFYTRKQSELLVSLDDVQKALSVFQVGQAAKEHALREALLSFNNWIIAHDWRGISSEVHDEFNDRFSKLFDGAFSESKESDALRIKDFVCVSRQQLAKRLKGYQKIAESSESKLWVEGARWVINFIEKELLEPSKETDKP